MIYPFTLCVAVILKYFRSRVNCTRLLWVPGFFGMWFGVWNGAALSGPFSWTDDLVCILGVWFEPDIQMEKVLAKGRIASPHINPKEVIVKRYGCGWLCVHLYPHPLPNLGTRTLQVLSEVKSPPFCEMKKA